MEFRINHHDCYRLKARERRIVARFKMLFLTSSLNPTVLLKLTETWKSLKQKLPDTNGWRKSPPEGEYYVVRPATEEDFEIIRRNR